MKLLRDIVSVRRWRQGCKKRVVLVPTMGALHRGHTELMRLARKKAGPGGKVAASVFVNPTQFGPSEDFQAYPRPLEADLAACRQAGADAVFVPEPAAMYANDRSVSVCEDSLSKVLCGRSRVGHFNGVCTVVAKLFNILQPTHAVFGEKDWQQLAIIRRMVRDLDFPVEIVACPTIRETDGLALSSRNSYLSPPERAAAPKIQAALRSASGLASRAAIENHAARLIKKIPGARIDYISAVDAATLAPLNNRKTPGRLCAAAHLGRARLIDNIPLPPKK